MHGLGVSGRYFLPLARELAPRFRVLVPDLPGFGRSRGPRRALDVRELAAALLGLLDREQLDRPALVANSLGCQVATELALRSPHRVARLVLCGPTIDPSLRGRLWAGAVRDALREPPSLLGIVAVDYARCGLRRLLATGTATLEDRIEQRLPLIEAPTLVVHGARDAIVTLGWAEEAARLLPHGRLAVVAGGAHAVHYSRPAEVAAVVRSFLEEG